LQNERNPSDLSNIGNEILQGVNNTNNPDIYNLGRTIYNTISKPSSPQIVPAHNGMDNFSGRTITITPQQMKSYKIYLSCLLLLLSSCTTNRKKIIGFWAIDDILFKGLQVKNLLSFNTITFHEDGKIDLPQLNWDGVTEGQWKFVKAEGNTFLIIQSPHSIFNGKYYYTFYNDPVQRIFKVRLVSDSVDVICSNFFHSYDD
jgi:hypothetical protein